MSQYIITPNLLANGTIYPNRFCKMDTSAAFCAIQAGNNDPSIGVAMPGTNAFPDGALSAAIPAAIAGQAVTITGPLSQVQVQLGGTVPVGSFLKSDANGKAVVANVGDNLAAYTWASGVADDLIQCVLLPPEAGGGAGGSRAKVALAAVDTGGGVFAWLNPETGTIIIQRVIIYVTTVATGACSIDVGTTVVSATTQSDNLIDGLDVHTAAGAFSTDNQAGALGFFTQSLAAGGWVTASKDSGASAGLVGFAYIEYFVP